CDFTGADVNEVRKGIASDQRIGKHFLYPGPGYGGSCFPKDVKALMHTAKEYGMDLKIVQATEDVNDAQKLRALEKIKQEEGNLEGKTFAFWGAAFKANTHDVRESSSIYMAKALASAGAKVKVFDPVAIKNFMREMEAEGVSQKVEAIKNKYDAVNGCDGLIIMTEWR